MKLRYVFCAFMVVMLCSHDVNAMTDEDITFYDVGLRPGVTADIHVTVFTNDNQPCFGKTVFAVHGMTHTAATWQPLAEALFERSDIVVDVCRVVAIDLPGHGESGLPAGMLFGDLALEDYVLAIINTLALLGGEGIYAQTIMGHSMGGLLVQMVQDALIAQGGSLFEYFGIVRAVLLASSMPREIPNEFADGGSGGTLMEPFIVFTPERGLHIDGPEIAFIMFFFTNSLGEIVSTAPSVVEVATNGYSSPEALVAGMQVFGVPPLQRASVNADIFGLDHGTLLHVVTMSNDMGFVREEGEMMFEHLVDCELFSQFTVVDDIEAIHDTHISDPDMMLDSMSVFRWLFI